MENIFIPSGRLRFGMISALTKWDGVIMHFITPSHSQSVGESVQQIAFGVKAFKAGIHFIG
jgi:hypothetical protein